MMVLVAWEAQACPGCFSGASDESRKAFISTTFFMSAMPLLMFSAIGICLYRIVRHRAHADDAH